MILDVFKRSRNRGTRPAVPSAAPGSNLYPGMSQWGGIDLPNPSAQTVAGLPSANRAKLLIANGVASMTPFQMWTPDGFIADTTPTVLVRPNATYGTFDFVQMAVEMALMHGNFMALYADYDSSGYPQQLVPVPHGFWLAYYDGDGYLTYDVSGQERPLGPDEVLHVRANARPNQPMGIGVVAQFRRALGQQLDQQNYAADTYRSGSVPPVVIRLDKPEVDKGQADIVQNQWVDNHSDGRAPAVIPNTMEVIPIEWSPEDIQFLQAREFSVAEMAFMFNMDPSDMSAALATGPTQTYQNIEQRQQARLVDTTGPWVRRFEEAFSDLTPGGNTARLVPANLLRTDTKTTAEVEQLEIANETLTVDEARKTRGKRPLPKPKAPPVEPAAEAANDAPGAMPMTGTAPDQLTGAKAQPDPQDPNISQTPVKVKV